MRIWAGLALAMGVAAGARAAPADEDVAARAFVALRSGKLSAQEAGAQLRAFAQAMDRAGLRQTATVALFMVAAQEDETGPAAEREVQRRAADDGLALALALRFQPSRLDPAAAVRVARAHLEQALVLSPPEEGEAFATMAGGDAPGLLPASAGEPVRGAAPEPPGEPIVSAVQRLARAELERARQIAAQVPARDPAEGEAHEVSALAALAAADTASAEKEFEAIVRIVPRGDAAIERRENALLQLARLAYARGDDARAQAIYAKVSRGAPQWLDALFEASWSHFRRGEDEKALGNLLTLHAPFFQGRYFPESNVLKALVLYENCRYGEARRALQDFETRFQPVHDALVRALSAWQTAPAVVEALMTGAPSLLQAVPEGVRLDVRRLLSTAETETALRQIAAINAELDSMDRRATAFRSSALALVVIPQLRAARLDLVQRTGDRARSGIALARSELRELLGQALRLDFEIAGREKELAEEPAAAPQPKVRKPRTEVEDDEELWPFQGEYWRDELGSYRFKLGDRCTQVPKTPVQQARVPQRSPTAAAAAETAATPP
jgi:hypothetical protein